MDLGEAVEKVCEKIEPYFEDDEELEKAWSMISNALPPYGEGLKPKDLAKIHIEKALDLLK